MIIDTNYKFKVSLSVDAYTDKKISGAMIGSTKVKENRDIRKKYGYKANKGIGYKEVEVTATELYNALINGHVFCHLFNPIKRRKDGTFGSSQKNNENFIGSYVVGVDIDHTNYTTVEDYIKTLSLKPTFYYTSYSNLQEGKGCRFRLIYVFDTIIKDVFFFRYVAYNLNKIIEGDTGEVIDDDCNLRCSQYFNGTNLNNKSLFISSGLSCNIYSLNDLNITNNGFIDFLNNNCYYKTNSHKKDITYTLNILTNTNTSVSQLTATTFTTYYNEIENKDSVEKAELYSKTLVNDMGRLEYDEFMKYNRHKYHYYYRVEKEDWINNTYQKVDENYFALPFSFGRNSTIKDGNHRRKKVFMRMCLRRVMCPNVDANTILFNAYEDIHKFFDFDGIDIEDYLTRNIEYCFNKSIEDIEEEYSEILTKLRRETKPKKGLIYRNKKAHTKENTYIILDEYYNKDLSVSENLVTLSNLGYIFKKDTIYNYIKDRKIKNTHKISDEELYDVVDVNLSIRENMTILKDSDIKISKDRLSKVIKNKKNNISNTSATSTAPTIITTYYNEIEKKDSCKDATICDKINDEFEDFQRLLERKEMKLRHKVKFEVEDNLLDLILDLKNTQINLHK